MNFGGLHPHDAIVFSQAIEYEVLPESQFTYGMQDDQGGIQAVTGSIRGNCRAVLMQAHGETRLIISSLQLISLTEPEIRVTGAGRWSSQYGSASDIAKFGLQYAEFVISADGCPKQIMATWPEPTIASVEFPAVQEGLSGSPFNMIMCMIPAGEEILRFFRRGDIDGDEDKDIADAIVILRHLFQGGSPPSCLDAADVNDDGSIALDDALLVLTRLFLGGALPPVPAQHCGIDPTDDLLDCQGQEACKSIDRRS